MTNATNPAERLDRNGRGEFTRSQEQAEWDRRCVEAYREHRSYRKAARALDTTATTVYRAHMRALAEAGPVPTVNEMRSQSLAELDAMIAELWPVARGRHPVFHRGVRVVGARDFGPNIAAIREIRLLNESRRRLAGTDAPQQVTVTVRDEVQAEIDLLLAELDLPDPALLAE